MDTFNMIVFLWQVSLVMSLSAFLYSLLNRSWVSMLISFITFLPVAYYFSGAENEWRLVAFIPIVLIMTTIIFWRMGRDHRLKTR
jgi:hypothetical protein